MKLQFSDSCNFTTEQIIVCSQIRFMSQNSSWGTSQVATKMQVRKMQVGYKSFQMCNGQQFFSWISKHLMPELPAYLHQIGLHILIFWHFDATYITVPHQFYQLFTIFVACHQYMFPVCFILMTRKIKDLYIVAFNKVKELLHNFLPVHDFIRWLNSSN